MHHYFIENENIEETNEGEFDLILSEDDIKHVRAQRLNVGEHISVVDKSSNYFEVEVISIIKDSIRVKIAQKLDFGSASFKLSLFYCLSKSTKTEDVIRAATEIGIDDFYPIVSERSVIKVDEKKSISKLERYKKIARQASMQSGRKTIPSVHEISNFKDLEQTIIALDNLIVFWERASSADTLCKALMKGDKKLGVVVGPEGGLDESEVEYLKSICNANVATMGESILRTETAGTVACALVKYELTRGH